MRRQRGIALIHAIMFTGLLCTVVLVVTGIFTVGIQSLRTRVDGLQAMYAAESGIAAATAASLHRHDGELTLQGTIGRGSYVVRTEPRPDGTVVLRSTGTCGPAERLITISHPPRRED